MNKLVMQSIIFLLMKYYWPAWSTGLNQTTLSQALCHFVSFRGWSDPAWFRSCSCLLHLFTSLRSALSEYFYHYITFVNFHLYFNFCVLVFRLQESKQKRRWRKLLPKQVFLSFLALVWSLFEVQLMLKYLS